MTDLCYNCLNCHLPEPCKQDLVRCEICYAWGHQFLFCPRGVHLRLPDYTFFALCQNCDVWHLPEPCPKVFHICGRCTNPGHLEHFCPVNSNQKVQNPGIRSTERGAQHLTPPSNGHFTVDKLGLMAHDTITQIKLDAVNQAFSMLGQGRLPFQIIEFMGGPYRPHQTLHPEIANARMAAIGQHHLAATLQLSHQARQPTLHASPYIQPKVEQTDGSKRRMSADSSKWPRLEPKPASSSGLQQADVSGTYAQMQQRFDQGELARGVEQQHLIYILSREDALSAMQTNPLLQEATPMVQAIGAQPTAQILLKQATPRVVSAALNTQDANLAVMAGTLPTGHDMSQLQGATPNLQDTAFAAQSPTMAMEGTPNVENAEDADDTGTTKTLKAGKKKLKLSTKTETEGTLAGMINQGPRCAKCIKAHKRCTHRTQSPVSALPLGPSPLDTPSTPSTYVPLSGVAEGYVPASITMPGQVHTRPVTSVETPVQAVVKKTTAKRKR